MSDSISKTERRVNFIKAFHENEQAMQPFKDFRSELAFLNQNYTKAH